MYTLTTEYKGFVIEKGEENLSSLDRFGSCAVLYFLLQRDKVNIIYIIRLYIIYFTLKLYARISMQPTGMKHLLARLLSEFRCAFYHLVH